MDEKWHLDKIFLVSVLIWYFVTETEHVVYVVADEPQLMLTAGPSAMVYGTQPGMYGTYPPSGMPGYGMQM